MIFEVGNGKHMFEGREGFDFIVKDLCDVDWEGEDHKGRRLY